MPFGLAGLTTGPDNNLWFTDELTGVIGTVTTAGKVLNTYTLPAGSHPQGITTGPDGNLWSVAQSDKANFKVGKITIAGQVTELTVAANAGIFQAVGLEFAQIVSGPDGNLWFVNPQLGSEDSP